MTDPSSSRETRSVRHIIGQSLCWIFTAVIMAGIVPKPPVFSLFLKLLLGGLLCTASYCLVYFSVRTKVLKPGSMARLFLFDAPLILNLTVSSSVFSHLIVEKLPLWPWSRLGEITASGDLAWLFIGFHLLYVLAAVHFTLANKPFFRMFWCLLFILAVNGHCFRVDSALLWAVFIAAATALDSLTRSSGTADNRLVIPRAHKAAYLFLGAFCVFYLLATVRSPYVYGSFRSFSNMLFCGGMMLMLAAAGKTPKNIRRITAVLTVTGAVVFLGCFLTDIRAVLYGINIFKAANLHLGGLGMEAAKLEFYAHFIFPLLLAVYLRRRDAVGRLSGGLLLLGLVRLLFCGYRKVLITQACWLIVFGLLYLRQKKRHGANESINKERPRPRARMIAAAILVLFIAAVTANQVGDLTKRITNRLAHFETMPRVIGAKHGFRILKNCLWLGNGPGVHYALGRFVYFDIPPAMQRNNNIFYVYLRDDFHNFFMDSIAAVGLPGLISLALLVISLMVIALRTLTRLNNRFSELTLIAIVSGTVGFFLSAMFHRFNKGIFDLPLEFWIGGGIILGISALAEKKQPTTFITIPAHIKWIAATGLLLIVLLAGILPLAAVGFMNKASWFLKQPLKSRDRKIRSCLSLAKTLAPFDAAMAIAAGDLYAYPGSMNKASEMYEQAAQLNRFHSPTLSLAGRMCLKTNQLEKAEQYMRQALRSDPLAIRVHDVHTELALCLAQKGKYTEAKQLLARAVEMARGPLIYQYWRRQDGSPDEIASYYFSPPLKTGGDTSLLFDPEAGPAGLAVPFRPRLNVYGKPINLKDLNRTVPAVRDKSIPLPDVVSIVEARIKNLARRDSHFDAFLLMGNLEKFSRTLGLYRDALRYAERRRALAGLLLNPVEYDRYVRISIGNIYACQERFDEALEQFKKARNKENEPLWQELQVALENGGDFREHRPAPEIDAANVSRIGPFLKQAQQALLDGNARLALEAFKQCRLMIRPNQINEYLFFNESIGKCHLDLRQFFQAKQAFRKNVEILARRRQNYDRSWDRFLRTTADYMVTAYLNEDIEPAEALSEEIAFAYQHRMSELPAIYLGHFSVSLFENWYLNLVLKGKDAVERKKMNAAAKYFWQAASLLKKHPLAHYHLASIYREAGDPKEAEEHFKSFLKTLEKVVPRGQVIELKQTGQ